MASSSPSAGEAPSPRAARRSARSHETRRNQMSDLVAIAYPDLATAQEVAANTAQLQKGHEIELEDMVIVERRAGGKIKLHQPSMAATGAASGALWGGLIGLIFFMPLLGMAIGGAAGAAGGAVSDYG